MLGIGPPAWGWWDDCWRGWGELYLILDILMVFQVTESKEGCRG